MNLGTHESAAAPGPDCEKLAHSVRFSIVIPTYNRVGTLRRAIESAMSQTLPAEVLVIDDGSSDDTTGYVTGLIRSIYEKRLSHSIIYHRLEHNVGHSAAMNAGIRLAKGDWVKGLDDDDYLAPNCLEEMARAISVRPAAVMCSCRAAQVNLEGVEIRRTPISGEDFAYFIPQEDLHYGMLLDLVPFGTPVQVAFRKDIALKSGGWSSAFDTNYGDEVDFWIRTAIFGDAIFINKCLAYRTIWSRSYNHNYSFKERRDKNYLMKEQIHAHVADRHRSRTPKLSEVDAYLNLHWGAVSLKNRAVRQGLSMATKGMFSLSAWKLFLRAIRFKRQAWNDPFIRRIPLTVSSQEKLGESTEGVQAPVVANGARK